MDEQRGFLCRVQEGTYVGEVEVWVDADDVERGNSELIKARARAKWRREFGPSIGMAYFNVKIIREL